jgi:hypothetical protein
MTFGGALIWGPRNATTTVDSLFKVARLSGTRVHSAKVFGCKFQVMGTVQLASVCRPAHSKHRCIRTTGWKLVFAAMLSMSLSSAVCGSDRIQNVISSEFCEFANGGCCVSRASSVRRGFRLTRIESYVN